MADVIMPQMGESIAEGTVTRWMKSVGDPVERDEPLFEISTDKVDAEIPSPAAGVLREIRVPPGTTVPVNSVVGVIADKAEETTPDPPVAAAAPEPPAASPPVSTPEAPPPPTVPPAPPAPRPPATPAPPVVAPAASAPIPPVDYRIEGEPPPPAPEPPPSPTRAEMTDDDLRHVRSSPVVRRIAAEHGVDLAEVAGTGVGGRVTKQDILGHIEGRGGMPEAPPAPERRRPETPSAVGAPPRPEAATPAKEPPTREPVAAPEAPSAPAAHSAPAALLEHEAPAAPTAPPRPEAAREAEEPPREAAPSPSAPPAPRAPSAPEARPAPAPPPAPAAPPPLEAAPAPRTPPGPDTPAAPKAPPKTPAPPATPPPEAGPAAPPASGGAGPRVEVVPMSPIRKRTAEHMVLSQRTSAHVSTVFEIDMTRVDDLRRKHQPAWEETSGVRLTYMPFILKAVIDALKVFPVVNARIDGESIVYHRDVNVGVAVALDRGLIVPVVHNADEKNLLGLARAVIDLAHRARTKKLQVGEVQGGTFTITNPGVFGSLFGTPIINQPQVAILGVGTIEKRPVVRDDAIAIRTMAYFALTFDHRLVDGADADRFMAHIKTTLQEFDEAVL